MAFCIELTLYARKNMVSIPVLRHFACVKELLVHLIDHIRILSIGLELACNGG